MREPSELAAIETARQKLTLGPSVAVSSWRISHLGPRGEDFFLLVFHKDHHDVGIAAVGIRTNEIMTSATLPGDGSHPILSVEQALSKLHPRSSEGFRAELVWKPCRASRSPLYPIWRLWSSTEELFVDQCGQVWQHLEGLSPGG